MKKFGFVFLVALFFSTAYSFEITRNLSLSTENIKSLNIKCGAGFLKIIGKIGIDKIEVNAEIVGKGFDEEKIEHFINLELIEKNESAFLTSNFKGFKSGFFSKKEGLINLTITIPKKLDVSINDGSGLIDVRDLNGHLEINDGSGSIEVLRINGFVNIKDGSGSIDATDIKGDLKIIDGSGPISIVKINGNVHVVDGSGSMVLKEIMGSVFVDDGSGSILIDGVEMNVKIENSGSGDLKIKNVKGNVEKN